MVPQHKPQQLNLHVQCLTEVSICLISLALVCGVMCRVADNSSFFKMSAYALKLRKYWIWGKLKKDEKQVLQDYSHEEKWFIKNSVQPATDSHLFIKLTNVALMLPGNQNFTIIPALKCEYSAYA